MRPTETSRSHQTSAILWLVVLLLGLAGSLGPVAAQSDAGAADPDAAALEEEIRELEEEIFFGLRSVTVPEDVDGAIGRLRALLERPFGRLQPMGVTVRKVGEPERDAPGDPISFQRVVVTSRAPFEDVLRWIRTIERLAESMSVGEVRLAATSAGDSETGGPDLVDAEIHLRVAIWNGFDRPTSYGADWRIARREMLRASVARLDELAEKKESAGVGDLLSLFAEQIEHGGARATEIHFDGTTITARGVLAGAAARRHFAALAATEPATKVATEPMDGTGCDRFELTQRAGRPKADEFGVWIEPIFDGDAASRCGPSDSPSRTIEVSGEGDGDGTPGETLRIDADLRAVPLAELLSALHELGAGHFVWIPAADAERPAFDARFEGASAEEVFAALDAAGVRVGPGPLRRVGLAVDGEGGASEEVPAQVDFAAVFGGDPPLSILLVDAVLREALCSFRYFAEGLVIEAPADLDRSITMQARDVGAAQVFRAMVDAADLRAEIEGERLILRPADDSSARTVDTCAGGDASPGPFDASSVPLEHLAVRDLRLGGLLRSEAADGTVESRALVVGPGGSTSLVSEGSKLFDAEVVGIGTGGVVFEGRVEGWAEGRPAAAPEGKGTLGADGRRSVLRFGG